MLAGVPNYWYSPSKHSCADHPSQWLWASSVPTHDLLAAVAPCPVGPSRRGYQIATRVPYPLQTDERERERLLGLCPITGKDKPRKAEFQEGVDGPDDMSRLLSTWIDYIAVGVSKTCC
ncbi:hypothetical protein P3342_011281 [Pyrenophora teres f. teres]|nr:hypothetical protein P3342_011281 [Pyrenophora teres f. teres]